VIDSRYNRVQLCKSEVDGSDYACLRATFSEAPKFKELSGETTTFKNGEKSSNHFYKSSKLCVESNQKVPQNAQAFLLNSLQKRIEKPNLYYVGPVDYKIEKKENFCSEYFDIEAYMPFPEEDLTKELSKR
jgi:hypothetical protein